jgi:hypothetical protein
LPSACSLSKEKLILKRVMLETSHESLAVAERLLHG